MVHRDHKDKADEHHDREHHDREHHDRHAGRGKAAGFPAKADSCWNTQYGVVLCLVTVLALGLGVGLYFQMQKNAKLARKNRGLLAKLQVERAIISADEKKIRMQKRQLRDDQNMLLKAIHDRGNVFLDVDLGMIVLKSE